MPEQIPPSALLRYVRLAEQASFTQEAFIETFGIHVLPALRES